MLRPVVFALAAVAAVMLGPTAGPALAQGMQQRAPTATEFADEDLQAFARASLEVQALNAKWLPRLSEAGTEEEAQKVRAEATSEMADAVRDEGLSVADYNAISQQAQQDPQLAGQIQAYQQDAQ